MRRASFIAEGAALALERMQREGIPASTEEHVIPFFWLRWQHVPSDPAIERAVSQVVEYRPEQPPVLALDREETVPPRYIRHLWLEELQGAIRSALPISDVLDWLTQHYPNNDTDSTLAGFTRLIFVSGLNAHFTEQPLRLYETTDGTLEAQPVELSEA